MRTIATPASCFEGLRDFPFVPHYAEVADLDGGTLRIHDIEEGPSDGPPVVLIHGNPPWCYAWRKVLPVAAAAGCRAPYPEAKYLTGNRQFTQMLATTADNPPAPGQLGGVAGDSTVRAPLCHDFYGSGSDLTQGLRPVRPIRARCAGAAASHPPGRQSFLPGRRGRRLQRSPPGLAETDRPLIS